MKRFIVSIICLLTFSLLGTLSAQVMETKGFIPNKGQYSSDMNGEKILGKFCGLSLDIWLTEEGVNIVYWQLGTTWHNCIDKTDNIGIQKIRIANGNKINLQDIVYTDSSDEVFHYYLAHCPNGIRDVHSFKKLVIRNIKEGVDWEISTDIEQGFVQRFVSSNGSLVENIRVEESVEEDKQMLRQDTFELNNTYHLVQERTYRLSQGQEKANIGNVDSAAFDWATYMGGCRSNYSFLYQSEVNLYTHMFPKFSFSSLSSSCTDKAGNLYAVGKSKLSAFRYYQQKDSVSVQDTTGVDSEAYISRFDSDGKLLWMVYYGSTQNDEATTIAINSNNEIYVGGGINLSWSCYFVGNLDYCGRFVYFKPWDNDFPLPDRKPSPSSDRGSCFFLKFNVFGERIVGYLFGPEHSVTNEDVGTDMKTLPLKMCFSPTGDLYVTGLHSSITYSLTSTGFSEKWGKNIPVFGPKGSDVYSYDDLNFDYETSLIYKNLPFILKIDTTDNIVWSTYSKVSKLRDMQVDRNGNLYIYGDAVMTDYPQTTNKKSPKSSWAYLVEFNPQGKQIWSAHIGMEAIKDSVYLLPMAMDISPQGHLFLTGSTTSKNFPIVKKEGRFSMQADANSPKENTFLMEFDTSHALVWSTLYIDDSNSAGWDILCNPQKEGSFFLVENRIVSPFWGTLDNVPCFLSTFDNNNDPPKRKRLPFEILPYGTPHLRGISILNPITERSIFGYKMNFISPSLQLSLSPYGKLFLTGNATSFSPSGFTQPSTEAYLQRSAVWDTMPVTGFILRQDLCDTTVYAPSLGFKDSLFCSREAINLELYVDGSAYPNHHIIWNAGTENEHIGDTLLINKLGNYFVEARSIYSNCPSAYGDTVHIKDMPIPTRVLPKDTLSVCVGNGTHFLSAYNEGCTYLWSDNSTDSGYKVRYHGDSIETVWCRIMNRCYGDLLDSTEIRFYPPYAYLGEDSVLCSEDTLLIDASSYNKGIPADLEYVWILSGDTMQRGIGAGFGVYVIRPKDSGVLSLQVLWPESECKVAKDTIQVSYYPYQDIDFDIIPDTTLCFYDSLRLEPFIKTISPDAFYSWYRNETFIDTSLVITVKDSGSYKLVGTNHCSSLSKNFNFKVYPKERIQNPIKVTDTAFCEEIPLHISSSLPYSGNKYLWYKGEELPEEELLEWKTNGDYIISQEGFYLFVIEDIDKCRSVNELSASFKDCEPKLELPNVFTPNDDGVNDDFKVKALENIFDFEINIFNRWGNKVYNYADNGGDSGTSNSSSNNGSSHQANTDVFTWTGHTNSGVQAPDGVYFYVITYKDIFGKKLKHSGSVTILR